MGNTLGPRPLAGDQITTGLFLNIYIIIYIKYSDQWCEVVNNINQLSNNINQLSNNLKQ